MTNEEEQTIRAALAQSPQSNLRDNAFNALNQVRATTDRKARLLTLVQEALAQLRVDVKYLIFDLEATRRERDEYKEQLEQR